MTPSEILLNREFDAIHRTLRWVHFHFKTDNPGPNASEMACKVNKVYFDTLEHLLWLRTMQRKAAYELTLARRTRSGESIVDLTLEKFEYLPLGDGTDNYDRLMERKPMEEEHAEDDDLIADYRARRHQKIEELLSDPQPASCLSPDGKLDPHLLTYDRRCYRMWLRAVAEHAVLHRLVAALNYSVLYIYTKPVPGADPKEAKAVADEVFQCAREAFDGDLEKWLADVAKKAKPTRGN